jgi:hypothetical protein
VVVRRERWQGRCFIAARRPGSIERRRSELIGRGRGRDSGQGHRGHGAAAAATVGGGR